MANSDEPHVSNNGRFQQSILVCTGDNGVDNLDLSKRRPITTSLSLEVFRKSFAFYGFREKDRVIDFLNIMNENGNKQYCVVDALCSKSMHLFRTKYSSIGMN